ncbi:sensor domain-containing diguanylate cyclase [Zobellella sp. DQSA1]|uniref:sensor domain-containing diguanylate cyclase n=1 Tax=Zobellella sp. DQSA1 TaxID=3342386 RepID=UPI0035C21D2A
MKPFNSLFRVDLRLLILLLALCSALLTLANIFYASYRVQHDLLIHNTLESNRVYAAKLADSTEHFFSAAQQQLAFSAGIISPRFGDKRLLQAEAARLQQQTDSFNTVVVVNRFGQVLAASPEQLSLIGVRLDTPGAKEALRERRPLLSQPYLSASNNLIAALSSPVFSDDGHYLGYIGGTLHLKEKNILNALLGEHYYNDGSYLYVVDNQKHLIYHKDPARIGERVQGNPAIDAVTRGERGVLRLVNSRHIDMLAGFAPVPSAGWGVVTQRPTAATLAELDDKMLAIFVRSLPLSIITLLFIWFFAVFISRPLWQLATHAQNMDSNQVRRNITLIRSWYFEAAQLKRAMLKGIGLLHEKISQLNLDSRTDAMTGLLNRRALQSMLERYQQQQSSFSIIALDIDHFKAINDNHGHDVGDQVIKTLAQLMRENSRATDLLCRNGGEEFMMLLPHSSLEAAGQVAERLRICAREHRMPEAGPVTISLGVTFCAAGQENIKQALKIADLALYEAKKRGRNRTILSRDGQAFSEYSSQQPPAGG